MQATIKGDFTPDKFDEYLHEKCGKYRSAPEDPPAARHSAPLSYPEDAAEGKLAGVLDCMLMLGDMLCVNTQKTQQGALLSTEKYCIECSVLQEILYASEAPHSKTGLFGGAFGCSFCKIYSSTAVYS